MLVAGLAVQQHSPYVVASIEMESDLKQIAIEHIDKIGNDNENRRPPNIVNRVPKSNKRGKCPDSADFFGID